MSFSCLKDVKNPSEKEEPHMLPFAGFPLLIARGNTLIRMDINLERQAECVRKSSCLAALRVFFFGPRC